MQHLNVYKGLPHHLGTEGWIGINLWQHVRVSSKAEDREYYFVVFPLLCVKLLCLITNLLRADSILHFINIRWPLFHDFVNKGFRARHCKSKDWTLLGITPHLAVVRQSDRAGLAYWVSPSLSKENDPWLEKALVFRGSILEPYTFFSVVLVALF